VADRRIRSSAPGRHWWLRRGLSPRAPYGNDRRRRGGCPSIGRHGLPLLLQPARTRARGSHSAGRPRSWPICPTTRPIHPGLPQDPVPRQACMRAAAFSPGFQLPDHRLRHSASEADLMTLQWIHVRPRRHPARTALPKKGATFTTCVRGQVALRRRLSAGYRFAGSVPAHSQHRTCAIGSYLEVS
jgi:hypothetical protein